MILTPKHALLTISQQLSELCKPLLAFDIQHFSYMKQFADGRSFNLSNRPEWIDDYYNLRLYNSSLFEDLPFISESKFDIWLGNYDIEVCQHGQLHHNFLHTISITEANPQFRETFLFSATPDNSLAITRLINHIDVLYHFVAYLKDRCVKSFKQADKASLLLNIENKGSLQKLENMTMDKLIKRFYQQTRVYKYYYTQPDKSSIKLTDREIDCLYHLANNHSGPKTAKLMNLSYRTVESYLKNIRQKLNCETKSDLFRLILNDKYLKTLR